MKMRKVFICSPYRGDVESNVEKAKAMLGSLHIVDIAQSCPI